MIYKHQFLWNSTNDSLSCKLLKNLYNLEKKMGNFSVEFGSESGSIFIRPLKEYEWYTNINFEEILLKTHSLVKS